MARCPTPVNSDTQASDNAQREVVALSHEAHTSRRFTTILTTTYHQQNSAVRSSSPARIHRHRNNEQQIIPRPPRQTHHHHHNNNSHNNNSHNKKEEQLSRQQREQQRRPATPFWAGWLDLLRGVGLAGKIGSLFKDPASAVSGPRRRQAIPPHPDAVRRLHGAGVGGPRSRGFPVGV